ncbi:stage 0 sporulation protein J [Siminovitchia terrae]|uniref:ParB/RepB/Spo0J family partition protein n=1 Tax=Siminovitchia terrae TaxID=1914933 RepID=A0A429X0P7_SIMTE|nr:ParB/RepB/Spo0J family partition protein [Siminovitchia terrae]RST57074.1 ParB/RepB/Spo0J family partition protein [Siminovitchia terrae]GIN92968.1 stage 0 sporulation protein J [Siminovitchia terrae]GIN95859.1 stage 0 sporulation protein J [Siminovitchia terrae]
MAKGLGKGINALFANIDVDVGTEETVREIQLTEIKPNPYQPRKIFSAEAIDELKESIKEHGILQPIIVRKSGKGYEIVAGERRFRAAKAAHFKKIPAVVREFNDAQMMELAVLENLQREDLTPMEEAAAYQTLMDKLGVTQEDLARRLGKSRPYIANHIRLLTLPPKIQKLITDGKLTMGHGRTLLGLKQKNKMLSVADQTIKEGLNVRQLERLIQKLNENVPRETTKKVIKKDVFIREREDHLREKFGTTVTISQTKKKGKIEIEFLSPEDLERILEIMGLSE